MSIARGLVRRQVVALVGFVVLLALTAVLAVRTYEQRHLPLLTAGLGVDGDGQTVAVDSERPLTSAGRVESRSPLASREGVRQRAWLAEGTVPAPAMFPDQDFLGSSLVDLYLLSRDFGVPLAGWTGQWRYVWPRDSSFVASALARTGHLSEARTILTFLQRVQGKDGLFQARYLPDGSGRAPDGRGVQLDGSGWALWALDQVAAQTSPGDRSEVVADYLPLLERSTAGIVDSISPSTGLPHASPDYWEVKESRVTLATSAVAMSGLQSASRLFMVLGRQEEARNAESAADRLASAIVHHFQRTGFPRHVGDPPSAVDLGLTFLQQPFDDFDSDPAVRAWAASPAKMHRPAGGLAPGGSWRNDGISWTPVVATYAMAAACQRPGQAVEWLTWLRSHRTTAGSVPEKVLANGSPASVSPIAWTVAAIVITADELQHGCPR